MKVFVFVVSILFVWALSSCNRNEPTPVPECCYDCSCHHPCANNEDFSYAYKDTLYQSDSFLQYWYFPLGSWWIYKRVDTAADVYDTAIVTKQERDIVCNCQLLGDVCIERLQLEIGHSAIFPHQNPHQNQMEVQFGTELRKDWVFTHGGTDLLGSGPHLTIPFNAATERGYAVWYEKQGYYTNPNYTFKDPIIYHYQNPNIPADSTIRKTNVIVKDVGLVYFYHRDMSEWELFDYHINN